MTREDIILSKEYWTEEIQDSLFRQVHLTLEEKNMSRKDLADKLKVTKGYVTQILNGNFDHRISKFVEISLAIGKVPRVKFDSIEKILELDRMNKLHDEDENIENEDYYKLYKFSIKDNPSEYIILSNIIETNKQSSVLQTNQFQKTTSWEYNENKKKEYI